MRRACRRVIGQLSSISYLGRLDEGLASQSLATAALDICDFSRKRHSLLCPTLERSRHLES